MKIEVRSETEARKAALRKLLANGHYLARIIDAIETASKAGNPMMALTIAVHSLDSSERIFRDYLVSNQLGSLKLRHACEAIGEIAKYEAGEIEGDDFIGKTVRVKIIIERRRGYPDQNRIEDYSRHAG